MKSNFKKQIIIALLGIIILSSWFCSIREVLAFIKINPANPKIQISSLQKGLVGHWNLDSESYNPATKRFTDKSAYSNHGTSANAASFTTDHQGQANQAMTFNGTSDYVDAGNTASLQSGVGLFTESVWVRCDNLSGEQHIISKSTYRQLYKHTTNVIRTLIGTGSISSTTMININSWYYIVFVYDGSTSYLYINGQLEASAAKSAVSSDSNNLLIGRYITSDYYFNGSIDEVRIYNRALSAEEILQSYNSYRPKISAGSLQKGLVLDMPMDSGYTKSTTVLTDRTPYSNNGTAVNGPVIGADYTTFDGLDDYVNAGNGASLNLYNTTTITAWVKTTKSGTQTITSKGDSWYNYADKEFLYGNGSSTKLSYRDTIYSQSIPSLINGQWHHIAVVAVTNLPVTFYFDGVNVSGDSTVLAGSNPTTNNPYQLRIGNRTVHNTVINYFSGSIDEVRIYNRALSAEEIQLSYDKSKGRH